MHTAMKILFIGSGENLRQSLLRCLSNAFTAKAKRFLYMMTVSYNEEKENLVREYLERHDGKLPLCMENT
jgi:hypothetical protein